MSYETKKSYTSGETLTLEYKDDTKNWSDNLLIESAVALANCEGGEILLGMTNNGKPLGSGKIAKGDWKDENIPAAIILANTQPALSVSCKKIIIETKEIICVSVPKAYTTTGTKSGKYLKRTLDARGKPQNLPMTPDQIIAGMTRVGTADFSSTALLGSSLDDIDLNLVEQTAKSVLSLPISQAEKNIFQQPPKDILQSLGLLTHEQIPNVACILLFGTQTAIRARVANHVTQFQVFGTANEVLDNQILYEPIAFLFPKLLSLSRLQRNSDELRINGQNVVIPEYSEDSIRESFSNALVHRDYTLQSGIQIQVYEKELSITSPGGFLTGVSHNNLLSVPPTPRNRRLTEAMAKLRFVETSGRGIDLIFMGQARYGRPAPDYSHSDNDRVNVRLVGGKANLDFCRFVLSSVKDPSAKEMLLLNAMFFKGYLLLKEAQDVIQQPKLPTEEILFNLNRKGLIEISPEETTRYFIKASIHHTTRDLVKPARLKKTDMEKFKKLILVELQRRSPINANDVADAVGLSASQTYRLLQQMKKDNKVMLSKGQTGKKWQIFKI